MRCLSHDSTRIWCARLIGRDRYSCVVAPFVVAVYCCLACVEYGDGQNVKVVDVSWGLSIY